jgi:hypothetical protein
VQELKTVMLKNPIFLVLKKYYRRGRALAPRQSALAKKFWILTSPSKVIAKKRKSRLCSTRSGKVRFSGQKQAKKQNPGGTLSQPIFSAHLLLNCSYNQFYRLGV